MMAQLRIAETLASLPGRCERFFRTRGRAGFPWFWPAWPPGQRAMVQARRMVRWHFGRDHHPVRRKLAQVVVTIAWPLAVLLNLWEERHSFGPRKAMLKRVPGALWSAIRHNISPSEYYAYGLWQSDRRKNIDSYLYTNEASRLFKVLNQPSEPDPVNDKLEFYAMCKVHGLPTPAVVAAFTPTGRLLDLDRRNSRSRPSWSKPRAVTASSQSRGLIEPTAWARCEAVNKAERHSLCEVLTGWAGR